MKYLILDTETTGLGDDAEIVEICVIDNDANVLLDRRIKPVYPVSDDIVGVHGITNEMLKNCAAWDDVYHDVMDVLHDRVVYAYKSVFDVRMINQTTALYDDLQQLMMLDIRPCLKVQCAMKMAQKKLRKPMDDHLSLSTVCELLGINFDPSKNHSAHYDCIKTLEIIKKIKGD